jgi:hypothetical protein
MLPLLLVGCAACGEPANVPSTAAPPPIVVDFAKYSAFYLWPCMASNGGQSAACDGIVRRYLATIADAPTCDAHASSCVRRPVGSGGPGGALLCNCTTAVYAGNTQAVDSVLTEFYAGGCNLLCCACPTLPPAAFDAPSSLPEGAGR